MELIKVTENNGNQVVSARELHQFLEVKSKLADWFPNQVERAMLIENDDFVKVSIILDTLGGKQNGIDFAITLSAAKEIAMLNGGEKGKQARLYFIEMEKKAKRPLTQIEIILQSAQLLADIEKKQLALENRIELLENKPQINAPIEHFSIMGYCHNIGKQISINEAKRLSIKCKQYCNQLGLVIGKVADPRFGSVNTYPLDILREVIE